jgi:hypothetical protein
MMYRGRICEIGTAAEVSAPPHHPYTRILLASAADDEAAAERAAAALPNAVRVARTNWADRHIQPRQSSVNHRTASVVSIAVVKMMPSLLRARSLRVGMHMRTLWPNAVSRALSPIRRSCRAGASNAPQFHRREPSPSQADLCARSRRGRPLTRQPETPQTIACHRSVFGNVMKDGIDLVTASSPLDRRWPDRVSCSATLVKPPSPITMNTFTP